MVANQYAVGQDLLEDTSNPGIVKVLSSLVFTVKLVIIALQGLDLLTSNLMIFSMAAVKRMIPWWSIPVNWIVNDGPMVDDPYASYIKSFAIMNAITPSWHQIFLRDIGSVWQGTGARVTFSKIIAIWFPVCIMLHSELTTDLYIRKSLITSLIGNIIEALFVGLPAPNPRHLRRQDQYTHVSLVWQLSVTEPESEVEQGALDVAVETIECQRQTPRPLVSHKSRTTEY
ncbi:hypothetical protein BDR03DRAFT_999330 [Suillus americanus]|nr:hypothetical protein BDR03DRAFT_999330 [Suillus americanus]